MKNTDYRMVAIGLASALLLACPQTAADGGERRDNDELVAKVVRQLGSSNFVTREEATQRLLLLGGAAEAALNEALKHGDREIRERSSRVLNLIRQRERETKLIAFRESSAEHDVDSFPGWRQFSERFGSDGAARDLYAQMLHDEWSLLEKFFDNELREQQRSLTSRRYLGLLRSQVGYPNYSVGTMLTFFFIAAESPNSFDHHPQLSSWVRHRKLTALLSAGNPDQATPEGKLVRKVVGAWIMAASGLHLNDRLALQLTMLYQLREEGRMIAEKVLKEDESLPLSKSMAMQAIVLRHDTTQIKLIEPYLEDATILSTTGKRQRQLRDIALACLMQLNGHDVAQIGVKPLRNTMHYAFDYNSLGFTSDEDRERAFELFRKLQAKR